MDDEADDLSLLERLRAGECRALEVLMGALPTAKGYVGARTIAMMSEI